MQESVDVLRCHPFNDELLKCSITWVVNVLYLTTVALMSFHKVSWPGWFYYLFNLLLLLESQGHENCWEPIKEAPSQHCHTHIIQSSTSEWFLFPDMYIGTLTLEVLSFPAPHVISGFCHQQQFTRSQNCSFLLPTFSQLLLPHLSHYGRKIL
jgi:hypothetical protein